MKSLKQISEQTIVLTGATSGIGLVTARMAADKGARLVLAARNEEALETLAQELQRKGSAAIYVVADVGNENDVEAIVQAAEREFGGFDTWINNAAVSIYGRLDEIESADMRRLFDTNFWGVVYGSRAAIRHFEKRGGGKLINIGSVLGERAIPIQGIYSASKHAVAGFTEALRMDVVARRLPISISLIKPSAIDTPYKDHAKNYMPEVPRNPPPVYEPEVVARAILHACEKDVRDMVVGGGGRLINALSNIAPRTSDRIMARLMPYLQRTNELRKPIGDNSLYAPGEDLSERSSYPFTLKRSLYTRILMRPVTSAAVIGGLGLALATFAASRAGRQRAPVRRWRLPSP